MWIHPQSLSVEKSVAPAAWVSEGLRPWGRSFTERTPTVASLVPAVFESYARILHPVRVPYGQDPVLWKSIAERNKKTAHPLMQFNCIDGFPIQAGSPGTRDVEPGVGSLEENCFHALVEVLSNYTSTAESCWFCLWDGFGNLSPGGSARLVSISEFGREPKASSNTVEQPDYVESPRVETSHREYILFSGELDAASGFLEFPMGQSPNIWWPDDRAWCVATEIDLQSTYVGGPVACIRAILDNPKLEAFPANPEDRVDSGSDTINC